MSSLHPFGIVEDPDYTRWATVGFGEFAGFRVDEVPDEGLVALLLMPGVLAQEALANAIRLEQRLRLRQERSKNV